MVKALYIPHGSDNTFSSTENEEASYIDLYIPHGSDNT